MQPESSTMTFSSLDAATSSWSRPTSPNSLMTTAVFSIPGRRIRRESRVVLPLPRKPVMTLTGNGSASAVTGRP